MSLFLLLFSALSFSHDLEKLQREAITLFIREIGPTDGKIIIDSQPEDCLRTGYQRRTGRIVFCPTGRVVNGGLESLDVINHEFFHALFCGKSPELCEGKDNDYLHEALADAFAYKLHPDEYFGENFYVNVPYIRKYQTDWLPGLVQSEHEKGSALASQIIRSGKSLSDFLPLFMKGPESLVKVIVTGREASELNRYRLGLDEKLDLSFQFHSSIKIKKISWKVPEGVITDTTGFSSSLHLTETFKSGKSYVSFLSDDGKEIGRMTFYLGSKLN